MLKRGLFAFMLSFFRRSVASPWGAGLLGLILIAFIVTLYEGKSPFGGSNVFAGSGSALATVGGEGITETELKRRVQDEFARVRQDRPQLDMATYVAGGGVEQALDRLIDSKALDLFGQQQGLIVSDRLVGAALAQRAEFKGPSGKFDEKLYRSIIAQAGISDEFFRALFRSDVMVDMVLAPLRLAAQLPLTMAEPYAALTLETRSGSIAMLPATAFANSQVPSDAVLSAFFARNIARYTTPERRIVRYATFDRSRFEGKVVPSEADIAGFYKSNAKAYAASEKRSFTQLVVRSEADAQNALAAVRTGKPLAEVAKAAGLATLAVPETDEAAFASATSSDVARAAFAAAKGSVAALAKSGLGYHIVRVDGVTVTAARSLDEARASIVGELTQQKLDEAVSALAKTLEDAAADGANFDDLAKKYALTPIVTPAVTAAGTDPDQPSYAPAPEMALVLRDAFRSDPDEDPAVVQLGSGRTFALWHLDKVVPSAPRKLTDPTVRAQAIADAQADAALAAARKAAATIMANANKGMPFAQAIDAAGVKLPPVQSLTVKRIDFEKREKVPAPIAMLFFMAEKHAKPTALPQGEGWAVVYLDRIVQGDRAQLPALARIRQQTLSNDLGAEFTQQFLASAKAQVGVTRDMAAIAAFKKALSGGATPQ